MAMPTLALPLPRYTVEDLERFPEDGNRYELLEGWLIVSPLPIPEHQLLVTELIAALRAYIGGNLIGHVYPGGGVQRGPDTHLVPDVMVASPRGRPMPSWDDLRERWLAVEVLSPSTRVHDRNYKVNAYLALGVREVWLVDPWMRQIEVHRVIGEAPTVATESLTWRAPTLAAPLTLDVAALFGDATPDME